MFPHASCPAVLLCPPPPLIEKVNEFKAFVIGGGGIFSDRHFPLFRDSFVQDLNVPIAVLGVGAK